MVLETQKVTVKNDNTSGAGFTYHVQYEEGGELKVLSFSLDSGDEKVINTVDKGTWKVIKIEVKTA